MEINKIYCESNTETIKQHIDTNSIDVILTSPFYNTNKKAGQNRTLENTKVKEGQMNYVRYDVFVDNYTNEEYINYCKDLFLDFAKILKNNGVICWNVSYGGENADCMFLTIAKIIQETEFTIADVVCWKKKSCLPNSVSPNKLTRIWEFVFIFCRKEEYKTFHCNKKLISKRENGQPMYDVFYNFIEAKNNDEVCPFNKATFSTDLVKYLLEIYCPASGVVYDPFMGTGTTAVVCKELGLNYIGSELSKNQCEWAEKRIKKICYQSSLF